MSGVVIKWERIGGTAHAVFGIRRLRLWLTVKAWRNRAEVFEVTIDVGRWSFGYDLVDSEPRDDDSGSADDAEFMREVVRAAEAREARLVESVVVAVITELDRDVPGDGIVH